MKSSNSSENKNFLSRCCTCLTALFCFNKANCCESRVDVGRMVVVNANKNSRGNSGNAKNPPISTDQSTPQPETLTPQSTPQLETPTPQSTPQSIDCRFFKNKINIIGINDDSYDVSNSKKLIEIREMHKRLIFSKSPMTRGLYTPTSSLNSSPDSSPQPLTKTSASNPLIFIHGPKVTNILAG
jgi:hypothetical protein